MSKMTNMCAALLLQAILSVACGNKGDISSDNSTIEVNPAELSCTAPKTELPLTIKASGSFQVFAADDCDWARVNPSYSRESSATVVVSVDDNVAYKDRSTEITIKCGTLRKKVRLTQAAMEKGEIDIDVPDGYSLVWNDEFESGSVPDTKNWWYETGATGWGNNELQNYVACSQDGVDLASISGGTLKIKAQGDRLFYTHEHQEILDLRLVRSPPEGDRRGRFLASVLDDASELQDLARGRGSGYHGICHLHPG